MADKFLSLASEKQRVFSLDTERFNTTLGERPVVVTAERSRIAVFCGATDGSWLTFVREHEPLDRTPRRPDSSHLFGWSRQIAVASSGERIVLAYKRRFKQDDSLPATNPRDLWLDVVRFDEVNDRLNGTSDPVRVPREALGINAFGVALWSDRFEDRLVIVVQAFLTGGNSGPSLVLLSAPFPEDDGTELASEGNWKLIPLDAGGWDFDARREGERLLVVHRRTPATYAKTLRLPPLRRSVLRPIVLTDDPAQGTESLAELATGNLVLLEASLLDGAVRSIDDSLPFGELPQIHRVTPVVITMERLSSVIVECPICRGDPISNVSVFDPRWRTCLVMATSLGWRAASLLVQARDWPSHLVEIAEAHLLISLRLTQAPRTRIRLELAALFSESPVSLFKFEEMRKGTHLTFTHRDSTFGSLRATTFRVFPDDGGETLVVQPEAYSTLDIGHQRIRARRDVELPVEHERFKPLTLKRTRNHEDGYELVRRGLDTANTLAWGLSGADDNPHTFHAYADMGDGGARVVYDQALKLAPPKGSVDAKVFVTDTVPEQDQSGTAWVELQTPGLVDTGLAGYLVLPFSAPRSLTSSMQTALDLLPVAALSAIEGSAGVVNGLTGGGELIFRDAEHVANPAFVTSVLLTRDTADILEDLAVEASERETVSSESDQPFVIEFDVVSSIRFASRTIVFQARVFGFQQDEVTYDWEFSDGTTDSGRLVEHTFPATLPDMSTANPAAEPDDPIVVTLTITSPDGQSSTASTSFVLPGSLWATLWDGFAAFRRPPDDVVAPGEDPFSGLSPGFFATGATVDLLKYIIEYETSNAGAGVSLRVSYKELHTGRFQFVRPSEAGQGDTNYELPISIVLRGVRLTGNLGSILGAMVRIDSVEATMLYSRRFQACIQTSERRDTDTASETVIVAGGEDPVMAPSALCCVPKGDTSLTLDDLQVTSFVTDGAKNLAMLVAALISAGFTALILIILLPLLIVTAPVPLVTMLISTGVSAIIGALVAAGVAWVVVTLLEVMAIQPLVKSQIQTGLSNPSVKEGFDSGGLMTYAGEGLAESLAVHLILRAQAAHPSVAAPDLVGRDRLRPQFFETIAVEEGRCKAKIRV